MIRGIRVVKCVEPASTACCFCGKKLDDPAGKGRPRMQCGAGACVRAMDARRQRRKRAGFPPIETKLLELTDQDGNVLAVVPEGSLFIRENLTLNGEQ